MKLATCHPNRKMQAREMCKPCYDKWLKSVNIEYKQNQILNTKKWVNANKERVNLHKRKYDKLYPEKKRNSTLKRKYGITNEDYNLMFKQQNGGCKICTRKPGERKLHVDHCHKTNLVRGLLCHQCNWYMGTIDSSNDTLLRLYTYATCGGKILNLEDDINFFLK